MTRPGGRGAALLKALKERQEAQTKPGKPDPEDSPPTKPVDSPDQFTDVSEYREKSDSLEVIAKLEKPQEEAATVKADLPENAKTEDSVNIESPQKVSEEPQITANEFVKKKGSKGRPIDLASNFIALEAKEGSGIYEYKVQFDPPQDMMRTMYECLNQLSDVIGTNKMFNGCLLILPVKLADSEFKTKALDEDVTVTLTLTASKGFSDPSCLRLYQVLLNRTFKALKLFSVKAGGAHAGQRSYFDPANKNVLVKHNIEIWPGYITNIDHFDGGVFLMFDSCNKVIRTETVADVLAMCFKKNPKGFPEVALKSLLGQSIMTRYNNRSYRIDDLNLDMSPESTFERIKGEPITFLEYYKNMYEITIKDTKQPLLIHYVKRSGVEEPIQICLVPELCFLTGLSETQRADFKVMQDVSDFTRLKPTMRQDVFQKFIKSILDNPEAVKYWHDWGLTISPKNLRLQGRLLPPTTLHFGNGYKEAVHGDWGKTATNRPVLTAVALEKWALIYPSNLERSVKSLTTTFQQQAPRLGMTVKPPKIIVLPNDKTELYLKAIRELPDDAQLVMAIFGGSQRADRYAALKKVCCLEKPLASQVIMQKTLANEKRLQSVVQKVALQVNCKLGGQLWGLRIPMPLLMVVGIDVFKNKESGKKFVVGIVASVNDSFGQFYSEVIITDHQGDEMHRSVAQVLIKAMTAFREVNSGLSPKNMIIYRDGVNSGLLHSAAMEAKTISEEISSKMSNAPKLTFIVVQKRISTKLLHVANWRTDDVENPPAGTVVDHTVTSKGWNDFYLIPMKASLGTVSPTHFTIVMDEANMEADMVQQISYTLTHMYFNWTGNVKVPAPCQYGHKLVELVSSHLHKEPHQNLSRTLYYL